ncbi:protein AATF [Harpegnathos saltator]|uniref:protein AATF n=1 Tax=Harpegnathos saltator TaxID=610380 RepID=UPI000DBEF139|nr:protein AATF [Harpegnathos saltator]
MALKVQKKSLADKINTLITSKPEHFDSDEEPDETKAKVVEYYDESGASDGDFRQSKIRRQNIDTLDKIDKRYAGKKVSRKDIYSEEDDDTSKSKNIESQSSEGCMEEEEIESQSSEGSIQKEEIESIQEGSSNEVYDKGADSQQESEDAESESDDLEDDYDIDINNPLYRRRDSVIKTMSEANTEAEMEKGNCVRSQLKIWENLLEIRIKLQKCIVTSNQMPQYDAHKELRSYSNLDKNFTKEVNETKSKLMLLLDNMLQLKELLLKQYPETKSLCADSKKKNIDKNEDKSVDNLVDEEIPSDTEDELGNEEGPSDDEKAKLAEEPTPRKRLKYNDYERVLRESHNSYIEYRDSVIRKWNEKTRIITSSLSKGGGAQTTLNQIAFAMSDIGKLRKKTRLKRSEYNIVRKSLPPDDNDGRRFQEYDPEIYDDDDFYHQLLRDLIEYKSADVTDPIQLSKQWIQLQNMRRKMKRKIDTRATKGRRVRYNIHNKLVNFMAPITVYDTWTDPAKNELYSSLFGKIKIVEEQNK